MKKITLTLTIILTLILSANTWAQQIRIKYGPPVACPGQTIELEYLNASGNATTAYWFVYSPSGTPLGTGPSFMLETYKYGNMILVYASENLDGSNAVSNFVEVQYPIASFTLTVNGDTNVCNGKSVELHAQANSYSSYYFYNWFLDGKEFSNSSSPYMNVNKSGKYTVVVNGMCFSPETSSNSITVVIDSLPDNATSITGLSIVTKGQKLITYTVPAVDNARSYIWTLPNGATGTSDSNSIVVDYGDAAVSGSITVKGHSKCGDGLSSSLPITVSTTTGIISDVLNLVKIYPSPFSDELTIENTGKSRSMNVEIKDVSGHVVKYEKFTDVIKISTSDFAQGIYILKLENETSVEYRKIIKE